MTTTAQQGKELLLKKTGSSDWRLLVPKDTDDKEQCEEARKAHDELKNVLLASLKMQHLVVLAGSGCSLAAGGPSMTTLWESIIGKKPTDEAQEISEKVQYDIAGKNIEAFLSRIEAFLQINDDEAVMEFLIDAKKIILDECSNFVNFLDLLDPNTLDNHKRFLLRLSRRGTRAPRLKIFTTNYGSMSFRVEGNTLLTARPAEAGFVADA